MGGETYLQREGIKSDIKSGNYLGLSDDALLIGLAGLANRKSANNLVYQAIDEEGNPIYIGITNSFIKRQWQHKNRFDIAKIPGLENLDRDTARGVEQVLIEQKGLQNLDNKINSISKSNPKYDQLTDKGKDFLKNIGFEVE